MNVFPRIRPKLLSRDRRYNVDVSAHEDEDKYEDGFGSFKDETGDFLDPEKNIDRKGRSVSAPGIRQLVQPLSSAPSSPNQIGGGNGQKGGKDPVGLMAVNLPHHPVVDIIFIHGLGGSAWRSWSWEHDPRNFWPPWLALEPELKGARIYTFGYAASIRGSSSTMNILEFAKDLLLKMKYEKQQGSPIGSLPIIFVTHSMGGLVAKKAYVIGKTNKDYEDVMSSVKSIIFLSTPHRGGNGADRLCNILGAFCMPKEYIKELKSNSSFLQAINDDFPNVCENLKLFSFYETKKTFTGTGTSYIVDRDSGILNLRNETNNAMVADHHTICKFEHRDDPRYRDVRNVLIYMVTPFISGSLKSPGQEMFAETEFLTNALSIDEASVIEQSQSFETIAKAGTCSWITGRKWFSSWLLKEDEEPHVLWISGPPGAGKSVLASYVVDTIRKQWGKDFCQYHAFVFSDKSKRSASYLFRSLAYQAARGFSLFRAKLLRMSDQSSIPFPSMSAPALWEKIFRGALFSTTLGKSLYWVIDGLDEAEPEAIPIIFQCFKSFDPQLRLKILLVSRPTTDVTMRVKQLPLKCTAYQLSALDNYEDIRAYVEDAVGSMIPKGVATGQGIVEKVLARAAGNFLWVSLATKDLEKSWHRQSNIDQTLSGFPGEMTPWYSRMMQKIEDNPDEETKRMALIFLTWATYAFRPLHIVELKVALEAEFPDLTSLEDTIHSICGDFVHVRGSRVNLIHETARHFLVNNYSGKVVSTKATNRHEYLTILCLRHLSSTKERQWRPLLDGVEIRRSKNIPRVASSVLDEIDPFLSYAATFWPYHLSLSQPDSQPLCDVLLDFFNNDALTWINALALLGDLSTLIRAAQFFKFFIKSREKIMSENFPQNFQSDDIEFLRLWAIDLIKLVGKFGSILVQYPSSIYKLVPPFCPTNSILRKTFGHGYGTFSVIGISSADWDDCHARLSVGADETATKVIATSEVFAALVPQAHSLVIWHAETCEELRRLRHGEYITEVAVNKKGDLVCTTGFKTIKIWELGTGRQIGCVDKHTDDRVLAVAFGTDNNEILVGYQDHLIVCQNWKTEKMMYAFRAAKGDPNAHHGLRVASFSPDGTQLAVGSRNRPVDLWDLRTQSWTKRCIMSEETSHTEDDVFQFAEVIHWHPNLPNLYILYHNTTLIDWNPVFDEQIEHQLGAKGLVCSPCGNYMLTSDYDGSIKVYSLPDYSGLQKPDFRLIYHIEYHDCVLDLAFSPDGQRFYDLRGSVCSVWEPAALVPADRPDAEEDRSSSSVSLWTVEPKKSLATPHNHTLITVISCAPNDMGFCCGRDDGTIAIHDMATGKKIRSLPGHVPDMAIRALAWSSSSSWVASGDDSGHVLVRKVQMPTTTSGKLTVYKPFDFPIKTDGINQLLFSSNEKYLLVSTMCAEWIWDVSAKKICHIRKHSSPRRTKWIEHPKDQSRLVSIDAGEVHIFDWNEFVNLTSDQGLQLVRTSHDTVTGKQKMSHPIPSSLARLGHGQLQEEEAINCITQTNDKRFIIFETLPSDGDDRDRVKHRRIELIRTIDVDPNAPQRQIILQSNLKELAGEVSKLVGSYQNRVVFFNHQYWLCTWEIGKAVRTYRRHLFLPKDWINSETLSLNVLSDHGTLLCPRNGQVAVIKNGIKF